jgi:hypothetical protein
MAITLAQIKTQARQRADMENNNFISEPELTSYINNSIAELHDILIEAYASDYGIVTSTINIVNGQKSYALPADFYVLKGVDIKLNDSQDFLTLRAFNFNERNRYSELGVWDLAGVSNVRYRIIGNQIVFTPKPDRIAEVKLWYVPIAQKLVQDTDSFNDLNSFIEYVIVDVAIKMKEKQEDDVSVLAAQKVALEKRIRDRANIRDAGQAPSISDIYAEGDDYYWRSSN